MMGMKEKFADLIVKEIFGFPVGLLLLLFGSILVWVIMSWLHKKLGLEDDYDSGGGGDGGGDGGG